MTDIGLNIIRNLTDGQWPSTVLFTGTQTQTKHATIMGIVHQMLYKERKNIIESEKNTASLCESGDHPDFIFFPRGKISIGSEKNPEPGTIRYMFQHNLAYAPARSNKRIIYFQDAGQINDEAESALLKTLEEPAMSTHIFLSADNADQLKETIISRAMVIPLVSRVNPADVPTDAWERFWFISGIREEEAFAVMTQKEIVQNLQKELQELTVSAKDFPIFDHLMYQQVKKQFSKENLDMQTAIMRICFSPVLYSLRDVLVAGLVPPLGTLQLSHLGHEKALQLFQLTEKYFRALDVRIFGTRTLNISSVFYSFLGKFMSRWQ